jgi:hypothetical protein
LKAALLLALAVVGGLIAYVATRAPAGTDVASGSAPPGKPPAASIDAAVIAKGPPDATVASVKPGIDAAPVAVDAAPIEVDTAVIEDAGAEVVDADPQAGFVLVKAPAGATVVIDDAPQGVDGKPYKPGVKYELLWGKHTVVTKLRGKSQRDVIVISAGKLQEVSFQAASGGQSKEPVIDPYNNAPR